MVRRLVSFVLSLCIAASALSVIPYTAVAKPRLGKPVVTKIVQKVGPVEPTRILIRGRQLRTATKVTFGGKVGTDLKRVSNTKLSVVTPRGAAPGTVPVRVRTKSGWSKTSKKTRYTFAMAPTLSRIFPEAGRFAGGERVELVGSALSGVKSVTFAGVAATIVRRAQTRIEVLTPPGTLGAAPVRVRTVGGTAAGPAFEYVVPPEQSDSTVELAADTVISAGVEWVVGGNPLDGPMAGHVEPWVVGLAAGTEPPAVGNGYVIDAGHPAHPQGLAGTVIEIAGQRDGTTRVTVAPTDFSEIFDEFTQRYVGPVGEVVNPGRVGRGLEAGRGAKFAIRGPSPFKCDNDNGESVSVGVDVSFGIENVEIDHEFDRGNAFRRGHVDFAITGDVVTSAKLQAEAAVSCELRPSWANVNRKGFLTPVPSLTVSFGPALKIRLKAGGTVKYEERTRVTVGFSYAFGSGDITRTRVVRPVSTKTSGSASFGVDISAGVSLQVGILDRVGIEARLQAGIEGQISIKTGPPIQGCFKGTAYMAISLSLYLDIWVARWSADVFNVKLAVGSPDFCSAPESSGVPTAGPEIVSLRLSEATAGEFYEARLGTADNRPGRWSADTPPPAGLSVNPANGVVSGTPSTVGDGVFGVTFTDNSGRTDFAQVHLFVAPSAGLGGGDVQITLTWQSRADLDLHVNDPFGEDIYYGNPEADSGGILDYDANAACETVDRSPTENVYWPTGEAPDGRYDIYVVTFDTCATSNLSWTLKVRVNGAVVISERGDGDSNDYYMVLEDGFVTAVGADPGYLRRVPAPRMSK